jgi:TPR repeat protein
MERRPFSASPAPWRDARCISSIFIDSVTTCCLPYVIAVIALKSTQRWLVQVGVLIVVSALCLASRSYCWAQPDGDIATQQRAALKDIRETASDICYTVQQQGQASETKLSGDVEAKLSGVITKLTNLGVRGEGSLTSQEYQGVLREQLASTLKSSADCRVAVFNTLVEKMMPTLPAAPPPNPSVITSDVEQAAKLRDAGRFEEAAEKLRIAVGQGNSAAQADLGFLYSTGEGVPRSYTEAARLYKLAAGQGNARGEAYLCGLNIKGNGVPQDYDEAARLCKRSADNGDPVGEFNLGLLLESGEGISQSFQEAAKFYKLAADQGFIAGLINLSDLYQYGRGVAQSYGKAARLLKLATQSGDSTAQTRLGYLYYSGNGVTQSYSEAAHLFRLAAAQGDSTAEKNLGALYENGQGVDKSLTEAVKWYQSAADHGEADAKESLERLSQR